jgi:hypothetical protein
MSHGKQTSTKRKRSNNAVPVLSVAGLSLSLASGASVAIGKPAADVLTPKTEMSQEITLCDEEISDVSLATFYIFDDERAGTSRRGLKLAGGGGCGGCSGGRNGGCGGVAREVIAAAPRTPILQLGPSGIMATRQSTLPKPRANTHRRPNVGAFRNKCSPRPRCRWRRSSPAMRRGGLPPTSPSCRSCCSARRRRSDRSLTKYSY